VFIVTIILSVILAFAFGVAGAQKVAGAKMARDTADHLGVEWNRYRGIGVLELLAAIGLLAGLAVWPLNVAAAAGLVLLMIGAVVFHIRAGDKINTFGPAIGLGVLSLAELIVRVASA
jgi:uncharacterized membrane protein YphA (DoxX/SURF4 family)